jgi:hypothetical protein
MLILRDGAPIHLSNDRLNAFELTSRAVGLASSEGFQAQLDPSSGFRPSLKTKLGLTITLAVTIETTCIHSVAGLTGDRTAWVTTRLFRASHHTI